jgi:hypothetical protein
MKMDITLDFGKFADKTIDWVALAEPGHFAWMLRKDVQYADIMHGKCEYLEMVAARANAIKIKIDCDACHRLRGTVMAVKAGASGTVRDVLFLCAPCTTERSGYQTLPPSLYIWPMKYPSNRQGVMRIRDELFRACGRPRLAEAEPEAMAAFLADKGNFLTEPMEVPSSAAQIERMYEKSVAWLFGDMDRWAPMQALPAQRSV